MKVNIPVRFRNPWFWVSVASVAITAIGVDPQSFTSWSAVWEGMKSVLNNPVQLVTMALAVLGVFIDPTTSGLTDSDPVSYTHLEPDHRKDMASQVGLVVNALARADLRLFVGVVPLPRPLLDRERPADDLHAAGIEVLVVAHLLLKDRFVVLADVFADRLAVRLVPDRDRLDIFVGVFFLGLLGHEAASLRRFRTFVRFIGV